MDISLFYLINNSLHNAYLDIIMPFITGKGEVVFLIFIVFALVKDWRKGLPVVLLSLACLAVADFSGNMLKHLFARPRPCSSLEHVRLLAGCGKSFSFPSNHAVNMFAVASVCSYYYRQAAPLLFPVALAVAYSRIYVGVHYPSDVAAGALWGIICACLIIFIRQRFRKKPAAEDIT